ncbi:hypothetical protein CAOG_00991 [Capsaspora owczarzaki ATCC 30864]|uniref:Uncharacterized protein n=1 Tax=Capsaspora owczarzaki (strain ATCC 30864) TaxID=595528 RepID=A0A0D2VHX4_CAPO3|nr:hypothetical protein CAOG_00991 [Capsaspora owczarzaki ATCC 30864]KJE89542.1 hypothetical protein CAOG_000991 [Capsaspora owczarzaki ATCC 30864]|eukprot:XP_004365862.1 hypothetical protein CAOG_00991 [Capsaspora owczarzaki ATCC 30864]
MKYSRSVAFMPLCIVLALVAISQPAVAADVAFGTFTDSTCTTHTTGNPSFKVASGDCKTSVVLGSNYRVVINSASSLTYQLGCDATCTTCTQTTTVAPGVCVDAGSSHYVTAHPLKYTSITVDSGTTCSTTSAVTVNSGACTANPMGGYMNIMDLGMGNVWFNMNCNVFCDQCKNLGSAVAGSCGPLEIGFGSFHINGSAALTASVTLIGMAVALLSAFTILG